MSRWLVDRVMPVLARKTSRRGFLMGTAMAATAVSVDPKRFLLSQCTPAAVICGPNNTAAGGYSAFAAPSTAGTTAVRPGRLSAVGGGLTARTTVVGGRPGNGYYIDCNGTCGVWLRARVLFERCWGCRPHAASGTCDQRRVCWNVFRYGQCNTHVACSGPVVCRVVSCTRRIGLAGGVRGHHLVGQRDGGSERALRTGAVRVTGRDARLWRQLRGVADDGARGRGGGGNLVARTVGRRPAPQPCRDSSAAARAGRGDGAHVRGLRAPARRGRGHDLDFPGVREGVRHRARRPRPTSSPTSPE